MAAGESNKGGVELAEQHDFVLCVAGGGVVRAGPKHGRACATAEGPSRVGAQAHVCI
jgi:hypothetical protein